MKDFDEVVRIHNEKMNRMKKAQHRNNILKDGLILAILTISILGILIYTTM